MSADGQLIGCGYERNAASRPIARSLPRCMHSSPPPAPSPHSRTHTHHRPPTRRLPSARRRRHISAAEGAFSVAQWLLDSGADPNPLDRHGRTPLEEAVRNDHVEVVRLMQGHGGKVAEDGQVRGRGGAGLDWTGVQCSGVIGGSSVSHLMPWMEPPRHATDPTP